MILAQRRHIVVAGSAVLLAAGLSGCGIQATGISVIGDAPTVAAPSAGTAPSVAGSGQVYIYLLQAQDGTVRVVPVPRTIGGAKMSDSAVAELLIKGPNPDEVKEGYLSNIPPTLQVTANALGYSHSYSLSTYLSSYAKTQFICTMQEFDQVQSIGYFYPNTSMTTATWLACQDTTSAYVKLPGFPNQGSAAQPVPTMPGKPDE